MIESFQHQLYTEARQSLDAAKWALPPLAQRLINQVVGAGGTPEGFLYGGFTTALALRATIRLLGRTLATCDGVLDFGCGPGRVMRWLDDVDPRHLYGVDINGEAIQWCRGNDLHGQFIHNDAFPPLPLADSSFDVIYAVSVLTHLDEQHQLSWLRELRRVLRPQGLLLVSVHGRNKARRALEPDAYREYAAHGFLFQRPLERTTLEGLPDFYQAAFHSREYVVRTWSRFFEVVLCVSHGPFYEQELVVLRKARPSRTQPRDSRLPLTALEIPAPASTVAGDEMIVSGWAFSHERRGPVIVDVWVDGRRAGCCTACEPRPDVGATFRSRHAERSGFSITVPLIAHTDDRHTVWLTIGDNPMPVSATLFATRQ